MGALFVVLAAWRLLPHMLSMWFRPAACYSLQLCTVVGEVTLLRRCVLSQRFLSVAHDGIGIMPSYGSSGVGGDANEAPSCAGSSTSSQLKKGVIKLKLKTSLSETPSSPHQSKRPQPKSPPPQPSVKPPKVVKGLDHCRACLRPWTTPNSYKRTTAEDC